MKEEEEEEEEQVEDGFARDGLLTVFVLALTFAFRLAGSLSSDDASSTDSYAHPACFILGGFALTFGNFLVEAGEGWGSSCHCIPP